MDREKITRNETTYHSIITACKNSGMWEKAIELLDKITQQDGLPKSTSLYNATISVCVKVSIYT